MNTNKISGKRLLAAILAIAMIACAVAVVLPSADVDAATDGPLDFDAAVAGYDSSEEANGFNGETVQATNVGLGNQIVVKYDADTQTYTLSGTLNKQNITYNKAENTWGGDNQTDSAKAFYSAFNAYQGDKDYGLVLKADNNAQVCVINADEPDDVISDGWILYFNESNKEGSYKVFNGETLVCTINYNFTLSGNTYKVVSTADELTAALSGEYQFIMLGANITGVQSVLTVNSTKTIDGAGFSISAVRSTNFTGVYASGPGKYLMSLESGDISVSNLTVNSAGYAFGLNVYGGNVTLNNVTSTNSAGAGFVVGGSATVNATDITATGYNWGGVNVDTGANFTANTISGIGSAYSETSATITIEDAPLSMSGKWNTGNGTATEPVYSDFTGYYASFADLNANYTDSRLQQTTDNALTITVEDDVILGTDFTVNENVNLAVADNAVLTVAEGAELTVNGTAATGTTSSSINVLGNLAGNGTITGILNAVSPEKIAPSLTTADATVDDSATITGEVTTDMTSEKIAELAQKSTVLNFPAAGYTVSSNLTLPSNVTVNLGGDLTVGAGVTLTINGADVNTENGSSIIVNGTLALDNADVYTIVKTGETGKVTFTNMKTQIIEGQSLGTLGDVGYGNTLVINGDFTIENRSTVEVYGTLNANGNLTVAGGASATILECGTLNVTGTMTVNGTLDVQGAVDNQGTMTIAGILTVTGDGFDNNGTLGITGRQSGNVNNNAALTFDATAVTDAQITVAAGATTQIASVAGTLTVTDTGAADTAGNSVELTNVAGVSVDTAVAAQETTKATTVPTVATMSMAGSVTAVGETGSVTITSVSGFSINEAVALAKGVTLETNGNVTVADAGSITAAAGATVTIGTGVLTVDGTVTINAATVDAAVINNATTSTINATYYIQSTSETATVAVYTAFDKALAAAPADCEMTVYGEQTAEATQTVGAEQTVTVLGELTVADGCTLTFAAGAVATLNGTVDVRGVLVFENFQTSGAADIRIIAEVMVTEEPKVTYTSLRNAIEQLGLKDITLRDDVTIDANLTVPADVTIDGNGYNITVDATKKNVTLTVLGTIGLTGSGVLTMTDGPQDSGYEAVVNLDGMGHITYIATNDYTGIAGAHYQITVDEVITNVISTVEYAAEDCQNVTGYGITVYGTVEVGDVVFDTADEQSLAIYVDTNAVMTVSSMGIEAGTTVTVNGTVTGSVYLDGAGTVGMDKVSKIVITGTAVAATDSTEAYDQITVSGNDVVGAVEVTSGTVATSGIAMTETDTIQSSLTVATGATLVATGAVTLGTDGVAVDANIAGTLDLNSTMDVYGKLTVTGTVDVTGTEKATGYALIAYGETDVSGTLTVGAYATATVYNTVVTGTMNVTGTLNIDGIVTVGELPTDADGYYALGTAVSGTMAVEEDATVNFGKTSGDSPVYYYVKAYYGATVTGLENSTVYNINGQAYMTVYAAEDTVNMMDVVTAENFRVTEDGLALDTGLNYPVASGKKATGLYSADNWFTTSNQLPSTLLLGTENIGDYGAVYTSADTVPVSVLVTVHEGLTLYIDGIPYASGTYELSVGTHSVFVNATSGFNADNATIVYGDTVINGTATGTIVISADADNATIVASGAVQNDIVIDVPSQDQPVVNVNTGDDKLSLTDYLLIVLVILIVIMAIIVALRLMRS